MATGTLSGCLLVFGTIMERELLFSVTAADCEWSYTRGTGKGGQKKNKTNSAVHCIHRPSGAHGYSEATRSQHDNRIDAFKKMFVTEEFQSWIKMESALRSGVLNDIDEAVQKELRKVKVEVKIDGRWTEVDKDDPLDRDRIDEDNIQQECTYNKDDDFRGVFPSQSSVRFD